MSSDISRIKQELIERASQAFTSIVRTAINPEKAAADAQRVRNEFPGLPNDALADILTKRAARKAKWEGAFSGLGVIGCEVMLTGPTSKANRKVAAGTTVVALLLGDLAYTTRVQMQLLLEIAELYECPFKPDDEEDIYSVFKAALGLKGTERVGGVGQLIVAESARKQFRKLLRSGMRRAVQDFVIKTAGQGSDAISARSTLYAWCRS